VGLFGTDGVRGRAGEGVLTAPATSRLAYCFGLTLQVAEGELQVALARDTRESGAMLREACIAGLHKAGARVVDLGVLPTPALAWLLAERDDLDGGIMITASHNPWQDNGLKLFAASGGKVPDDLQDLCEQRYRELPGSFDATSRGDGVGTVDFHEQARKMYLASLAMTPAQDNALAGRKVVADTAAGAACRVLPVALAAAGAQVYQCAPEPDGRNINDACGAVEPQAMAERVLAEGAWAGVAVDGDGDRLVMADELGIVHDGDAVVGFLAAAMQDAGSLRGNSVVGTVTSNGGLEAFLRDRGVTFVRTAVGDRHVSAAMHLHGLNLGGESSGHILTPDLCPSGDGCRVALHVLALAAAAGVPLSELLGAVPSFPAANRKVRATNRPPLETLESLQSAVVRCESRLAPAGGRLLLRYSGTEPVLRILVEGPDRSLVEECADELAAAAVASLGDV